MACGTPVIAARSGAMPELIKDGETGFLVDTKEGRIIDDTELKANICDAQPYSQWLKENMLELSDLPKPDQVPETDFESLLLRQKIPLKTFPTAKIIFIQLQTLSSTASAPIVG